MNNEMLIHMEQCSTKDVCIVPFFNINMKDNSEQSVGTIYLWEYR